MRGDHLSLLNIIWTCSDLSEKIVHPKIPLDGHLGSIYMYIPHISTSSGLFSLRHHRILRDALDGTGARADSADSRLAEAREISGTAFTDLR